MNKEILINHLKKYWIVDEEQILFHEEQISGISFEKMREVFYVSSDLLEEDDKNKVVTAMVKSGFLNMNRTIVAAQVKNGFLSLAIYTKQGLIKQDSNIIVLNKILLQVKDGISKNDTSKKKYGVYILIFLLSGVSIYTLCKLLMLKDAVIATKQYNEAVLNYNKMADSYNTVCHQGDFDNLKNIVIDLDKIPEQSEDSFSVFCSLIKGNKPEIIQSDIETLQSMQQSLKSNTDTLRSLLNPKAEWVESRLKTCEDISKVKSVSEGNDPNGLLGKDKGYSGAVYFTIDELVSDTENDPLLVGTDGGGCLEIYKNIDDANSRCEYLSQFDNSFFYTGSHEIIGTIVVRTSYQLEKVSQDLITDEIFKSLTSKL